MDAYAKSKTPNRDRDLRATPLWLVQALLLDLGIPRFDVDVCAEHSTAKAEIYWTRETDALELRWSRAAPESLWFFMNPPYSTPFAWCERAAWNARHGIIVVGVLPDDRGTRWYQTHIEGVANHCFLPRQRVSFLDAKGNPQAGNPKPTVCPVWTALRTGQTTYSRLTHTPASLGIKT